MEINKDLIISGTNMTLGDTAYKDIYYTTETKTNKVWIDGKPIYRKVIKLNNFKIENGANIEHNIQNINEIISYDVIFNLDGDRYKNFIIDRETGLIVMSRIDISKIVFVGNDFYLGSPARIYTFIIEYTKTTD